LVLLAGIWAAAPAAAASWADAMFDELSKDFGSVPRGPTLKHPFRVVNKTGAPVNISSVRVSCGCVTATALKGYLRSGEETVVLAEMDTTRFTGPKSVTIYVAFDQPRAEEVRLWVQANGRNDFNVAPDTMAFGQVKRGTTPDAAVRITFYGNTEEQVTGVRCESNYVKPKLKEISRQESEVVYEVTAKLPEDIPAGKWYTDLWLQTANTSLPQIRIPLTVEIESALNVTPDAVTLGEIRQGTESERRVIIKGVKPFRVLKVTGTDALIDVRDNTPQSKMFHVLTVKLRAVQAGEVNRALSVVTDLPEDNKVEFQVHATVKP
jgi:hypothetical protein